MREQILFALGASLFCTGCRTINLREDPDFGNGTDGEQDQVARLSDEEIAYLTLLFTRAGLPFDLNNIPADTDGDAVPNSVDEDADGDGILNVDDDDIDGDGIINAEDPDIDGDRIGNDEDPDIDADGIENDDDFDADSDSLSDRFDLNDDGDDEPDDEDEDDMGDEPLGDLEDLADRLRRGFMTERDRNTIVKEILERLNTPTLKTEFQDALDELVMLATDPNRLARPLTVPANVDALDQIYEQLRLAIREAKRGQANPNGPFQNQARERKAAEDMLLRAKTAVAMAKNFPTMLIDDINESTKKLRADMGPERLLEFTQGMRDRINPNAIGGIGSEKRELDALTLGGSVMGKAFTDADSDSIFDGIERLRARAVLADPLEGSTAKYSRLLNRLSEIKSQSAGASLDDAVTQVVMEDGGP